MSKTTKKTAAAKVAAAVTTTNNNTAPKMSEAAAARIAAKVAEGCTTCKEVAAKFAALVAEYGKENAAAIQTAAKKIVTDHKTATTAAATDARAYLSDGAKVAAAAWAALLKEDRSGARFASIVFDSCGRDLSALVVRFASYVATKDGAKVAAVKVSTKDENGAKVTKYAARDLSRVPAYLAALKLAIRNAKRAALGASVSDYQKEVTF